MIAYCKLPSRYDWSDHGLILARLQGVQSWEQDGATGMYFQLEQWMHSRLVRHLFAALRGTFGARIRFGAAEQKTTARAAALYRASPHCTIVTADSVDAFLSQLPIELLPGLGQRTTRFLQKNGVTTFAAFRQLSGSTLKEWFGVSGLILQQFARGLDPRMVDTRRTMVRA